MATRQQKFTRSEKRWLLLCGSFCLLLGPLVIGWQRINADPDVVIPTPAMPSPNAYDYYVRSGAALVPGSAAVDPIYGRRSRTPLSEQESAQRYPLSAKQAWLQQNAQALSLLRQGFHYPYLEPMARLPASGSPAMGEFRALGRLLIVESHEHSQQGDWASASHSALDAMKLGYDLARGGRLISAESGCAIQDMGDREMWHILPNLNAEAARTAAARLESLQANRVPLAITMQTEKWCGLAEMSQLMRQGQFKSAVSSAWDFDSFLRGLHQNLSHKLRIWLTPNRTMVNNYTLLMDASIANARRPYTSVQPLPPLGDPVTALIAPIFGHARWNDARTETRSVLLLVTLALRAYQLEHGAYPEQLKALMPHYLQRVPADPFGGGELLRYRRRGKTYLLWSIGSDGVDNGGQPVNNPRPKSAHILMPDSKGDVVAGVNF